MSTTSFFTNLFTQTNNDSIQCISYTNSTIGIYNDYMGIPQNLLINVIAWVLLLLLFAVLRKNAWNYGRIALVQRNEQRELLHNPVNYNAWTQLFYGDVEGSSHNLQGASDRDGDSTNLQDVPLAFDKGFCSWITAIFRVKDCQILQRSGLDAVQYLSFQRYIIAYVTLLTFISLVIVLPVNFQGNLEGDSASFGRTTMNNLDPESPLLSIHVLLSIILLPIGVLIMRHFSANLQFPERDTAISRTLMMTDIPKDKCTKSLIVQHFQEAYPEVSIQDIQFSYNIRELIRMDRRRQTMYEAKAWSENYLKENGRRLLIYPCPCSWMLSSCCKCGCKKEDAITYYSQKEVGLITIVEHEKLLSMERPLGICFITFQTAEMASRVFEDHQHTCRCGMNPPASSVSVVLEPYRWGVSSAPNPDDIYWENLSSNSEHWYLKAFCINFFIFFLLFFLTTPFVVVSSFDKLNIVDSLSKLNPLIGRFLPTLLLWTVAALLPVLVSYSDQFVNHWTRSAENHTVMRKVFIFLLFMIVILPSLGLTSAKAFVEWALITKNQTMRWQCVFLPDNGAFYVNYVITSAFVGSALELIRFPELFMYVMRLCFTRSIAERLSVRKAILWEFQFGVQYAWFLLVFATTIIYCISCPLVTPFGLVYVILKHLIDRHNIIFAYGPSKINRNIHLTAINFVVFSTLLLQMMILFFMVIRRGITAITIVSITFFCLSAIVFIGQMFFNMFKEFSPVSYTTPGAACEDGEHPCDVSPAPVKFIPSVLRPKRNGNGSNAAAARGGEASNVGSPSRKSYGTNADKGTEEDEDQKMAASSNGDLVAERDDPEASRDDGGLYQDYRQSSNGRQPLTAIVEAGKRLRGRYEVLDDRDVGQLSPSHTIVLAQPI